MSKVVYPTLVRVLRLVHFGCLAIDNLNEVDEKLLELLAHHYLNVLDQFRVYLVAFHLVEVC
jgi:hypothetical protein